jgi:membrane-associated phospholipid phosphatase
MIRMNLKMKTIVLPAIFACLTFGNIFAQNIDLDILKSINPKDPNSQFWKTNSSSAYWIPAGISVGTLVTGFIKKDSRLKRNGYETLISIGVSTLISEGLKSAFRRTRPADAYPNDVFVSRPAHGRSFPSGHTTLAFATATSVALQYKKWYIVVPSYLWAASIGYSRMYLGKHYPSDVLAGTIIGIGSGFFSHWVTKKIFKRQFK